MFIDAKHSRIYSLIHDEVIDPSVIIDTRIVDTCEGRCWESLITGGDWSGVCHRGPVGALLFSTGEAVHNHAIGIVRGA